MVGLMATAIVALFAALLRSYSVNADTIRQKDAEIRHCQEQRILEITALYKEVQEFREEIYRQAQAQQRQLKRIKK